MFCGSGIFGLVTMSDDMIAPFRVVNFWIKNFLVG
jgi:hypothetical protein